MKPFGRESEAQSPFLGTVTALCSSGTEIAIPAHSPLPARDISRARRGSARRASVCGLAGDGSGEGPYGRTQLRSAGSSDFHGTHIPPGTRVLRRHPGKRSQNLPSTFVCCPSGGRARVRISPGSGEIAAAGGCTLGSGDGAGSVLCPVLSFGSLSLGGHTSCHFTCSFLTPSPCLKTFWSLGSDQFLIAWMSQTGQLSS